MPGCGKDPSQQSVPDLWVGIIATPIFGGALLGVMLCAMLGGTPRGGQGTQFWAVLLVSGFLGVWAALGPVFYLRELVRRRVWVPPGTARHPILVAIAAAVLLMAAGVAMVVAAIGVVQLPGPASASVLPGAFVGGLAGGVVVFIYQIGRRLARKPPASQGHGATEPSPPAERPPE